MPTLIEVFDTYGKLGVEAIRQDVSRLSASGKTAKSVRYEIQEEGDVTKLTYLAREYFSTLETGRGPRKSDKDGGFKDNMLEYMKERGIGSNLSKKKQENLAKFLVLRINREGDETFKRGGRVVYSPTVEKLAEEVTRATKQVVVKQYTKFFVSEFKRN